MWIVARNLAEKISFGDGQIILYLVELNWKLAHKERETANTLAILIYFGN